MMFLMLVLFGAPATPNIPAPQTPPPPPPPLPAPAPADQPVQSAEAETRRLFRRRGVRSTLLTPGRELGVSGGPQPVRRTLLGE